MMFTPDRLRLTLAQLPDTRRYWIAFSGGCDSHVLLHAMAALRSQLPQATIHAVHVNHGLQVHADSWQQHCQSVCDALAIPLHIARVNAAAQPGESPEEIARLARYAVFRELLAPEDGLLLAHHQDDQAETLMLQLLRGAGVKGLASMPMQTGFAAGWLGRPLLDVNREALRTYASQESLQWIEDPSNEDQRFDRNYLRHEIMPRLQARWPATPATLSRVAGHLAESRELLQYLAAQDWQQTKDEFNRLRLSELASLEAGRLRNLLRYWLVDQCRVTCPDTRHLNRILHEVLPAAEDANPMVSWQGGEVRRYRGLLYALQPQGLTDLHGEIDWDVQQTLTLNGYQLVSRTEQGKGLDPEICQQPITVRYRQGGEVCKPVGRGHHHRLKKLFQEWGVPPWQRQQVPLIYAGDDIAQVVGYCICEPFQSPPQKQGYVVTLENNL